LNRARLILNTIVSIGLLLIVGGCLPLIDPNLPDNGNGSGEGLFNRPTGIAIGLNGNVYVTDTGNNRVQVFSKKGSFIRQWGSEGSNHGEFLSPIGIEKDSNGDIYVADRDNGRIQVFTPSGDYLYTLGEELLDSPTDIAFLNNQVFITDANGVTVLSQNGDLIRSWNSSNGILIEEAHAIAIDKNTRKLYVTLWEQHKIVVCDENGDYIDSRLTDQGLHGVEVDSKGDIYVATGGRQLVSDKITKYGADLTYITDWGTIGTEPGNFINPWGIAVDASDNVYVADTGGAYGDNDRIQVFTSEGDFLRTWGSTGGP
jgi:tripartite motif-containing protein 71